MKQLGDKIRSPVWEKVRNQDAASISEQAWGKVHFQVRQQVDEQVGNQVGEQILEQIREDLR
jgi:hypothetical protein